MNQTKMLMLMLLALSNLIQILIFQILQIFIIQTVSWLKMRNLMLTLMVDLKMGNLISSMSMIICTHIHQTSLPQYFNAMNELQNFSTNSLKFIDCHCSYILLTCIYRYIKKCNKWISKKIFVDHLNGRLNIFLSDYELDAFVMWLSNKCHYILFCCHILY